LAPQQLLSVESRPYLSRDSRISLPDEARQYIANMADSPVASPMTTTFSGSAPAPAVAQAATIREETDDSEFLEMDDDNDDEDEDEGEAGRVAEQPEVKDNGWFSNPIAIRD